MKKSILLLLTILPIITSCHPQPVELTEEGISEALARHRKETIKDLAYELTFHLPADKDKAIEAQERVTFSLEERDEVILDFREAREKIHRVEVNGDTCDWQMINDHLVIQSSYTLRGDNEVLIDFTAGTQSLNRRDGYVYTLFVPDRARTVFPCFEQPNLKATFALHLEMPESWKAVSNGAEITSLNTEVAGNGAEKGDKAGEVKDATLEKPCKTGYRWYHSAIDVPIPTYLFAFAAGEFEYERYEEDGYSIGAYHRETDSLRIAQLPEIMHQVVFALKWQEEFTGVKYPFPKYDLVILPGFQFGGMEHVGATFYNDNTLFLSANPTPDERLRRTELISHETSHMWFGDAVTMEWFDDVWTKEVFANYFAAEITEPLFPDIDHELNFLRTYTAAAISQDRTEGRTSIRQPLSNLRYAGLIYNNIIYNKAPVMMRKMVELMGKEAFRRGIQKYVKTYLYANATWDDLIAILDAETEVDLKAFSKEWVDTANWPHFTATDAQDLRIGKEYGYFELTHEQCDSLLLTWRDEENGARRQAMLMTLYENYLNGQIGDTHFMSELTDMLAIEQDPLTALTLVSYMYQPIKGTYQYEEAFDTELLRLAHEHPLPAIRTQLLRLLTSEARTPEVVDSLYAMWERYDNPLLAEQDYMTLAYELAVHFPERADSIISMQRNRLANPDRLAQFDYVSRAVVASQEDRDALFESLKKAENRRIEPWTLSVLYYLNHPLRQKEAVKYIEPALALLPDIQRTGDIFFPGNWCSNLLAGHRSQEAYEKVEHFLKTHRDYPQLLTNKILQAKYMLSRDKQGDEK